MAVNVTDWVRGLRDRFPTGNVQLFTADVSQEGLEAIWSELSFVRGVKYVSGRFDIECAGDIEGVAFFHIALGWNLNFGGRFAPEQMEELTATADRLGIRYKLLMAGPLPQPAAQGGGCLVLGLRLW
jgi:hypothetical protein